MLERHYVTFYFNEGHSTRAIDAWDVERAKEMAREVTRQFHRTPWGFNFCTRRREEHEMDSRLFMASAMYYLGSSVPPEDGDVVLEWP